MDDDDRLAAVGALGDRLRRSLYRFAAGAHRAVSRSEAAEATGVSRAAAAFHLDRLAADGLLDVEFRRLGGRRGPGAGRPTKLYRRAAGDVAVSLPPRRYDLAAELLAAAVDDATRTGEPVDVALARIARARGTALAAEVEVAVPGSPPDAEAGVAATGSPSDAGVVAAGSPSDAEAGVATTGSLSEAVVEVLADHGYEPVVDGHEVVLANCPFHALVDEHRRLVCGMNLALLEGFAAGVPGQRLTARLQPDDHHCCVRLAAAPPRRRHS